MEVFLIKAAQLILAFAILVVIHEFGHYIFARMFGMKVDRFYLFFNPWFSLFKYFPDKGEAQLIAWTKKEGEGADEKEIPKALLTFKLGKPHSPVKKNGKPSWAATTYGIGWLPLGGYCSINGMVDETTTAEQLASEPQPYEFRAKPAWQRLLVMIAGVLFNFLLAILIYAGIVYATGEKYVAVPDATDGYIYSPEAQKAGFHNGDIPLYADGTLLEKPGDATMQMLQAKSVTVLRGKDTVTIAIPKDLIFRINDEVTNHTTDINFMTYSLPTRIIQVVNGEGGDKAGLKVGDDIIAINGEKVPSLYGFFEMMKDKPDQTLDFTIVRREGNRLDTLQKAVTLNGASKIGVGLQTDPSEFYHAHVQTYNLFQSVPKGIEIGVERLSSYASSMKLVFTKEGAKSVGGFGAIGSIFPEKWQWIAFWNIAAFLSVALAFMNILPIPALDGGHVLFLLFEIIFRRKPSEKFLGYAQMVGMTILILLLVYANGMDIVRLFK